MTARWITRFSALLRLSAASASAVLMIVLLPAELGQTRWLLCWDVATFVYLALAWQTMLRANAGYTRQHAIDQDQSGYVIFLFVVLAACAGLVSIGFMVSMLKDLDFWSRAGHLTLAVLALLSAWLLIHTVFAFHYARLFYTGLHSRQTFRGDASQTRENTAELELLFPGGKDPDYLDFAYYSFVVGMTTQVSDVTITSSRMRRLTLMHSILSFIFNIAVGALSINIIASVI